jgi:hypothetical protein
MLHEVWASRRHANRLRNMTSTRNWRRARLTRPDGSPIPDDWTLEDATGQPLGRIYAETGGPQGGRWFWAVLVAPDGPCPAGRQGGIDRVIHATDARAGSLSSPKISNCPDDSR